MRNLPRPVIFAAIVLVAIGLVAWRYHDYLVNPWTRDGQVMANVIRIAPRVSGPVIELPIKGEWGPNAFISVLAVRGRIEPLKWYSFFSWGWREPLAWFREW